MTMLIRMIPDVPANTDIDAEDLSVTVGGAKVGQEHTA